MTLDVATAAVVAQIKVTIGTDGQPIGSAPTIGEQTDLAVERYARTTLIANLGQYQ
jgi:hypothetical protein